MHLYLLADTTQLAVYRKYVRVFLINYIWRDDMKIESKYDFFKTIMKQISIETDRSNFDRDEKFTKALYSLFYEIIDLDKELKKYSKNPEVLLSEKDDEIFHYYFELVQFVREQTSNLSEVAYLIFSELLPGYDISLSALDLFQVDSRIKDEYSTDDQFDYVSVFLTMYRHITHTIEILLDLFNSLFNDSSDMKSVANWLNKILYISFSLMKDCQVLGNHLYCKYIENLHSSSDNNGDT